MQKASPAVPKTPPSYEKGREQNTFALRTPNHEVCMPKMKWEYNKQDKSKRRVCHCEDPCTTSSCGRMFYIYPEKDFRAYPGTARGTEEWDSTYKIRVNVEKSMHADLLLAGITQLITVMVADKINKHQYIRSLKPLAA